jgi:hypothetical protein
MINQVGNLAWATSDDGTALGPLTFLGRRDFSQHLSVARREALISAVVCLAMAGYAIYQIYKAEKSLARWKAFDLRWESPDVAALAHRSRAWKYRFGEALVGVGGVWSGLVAWEQIKECGAARRALEAHGRAVETVKGLNRDVDFPLDQLTDEQVGSCSSLPFGKATLNIPSPMRKPPAGFRADL